MPLLLSRLLLLLTVVFGMAHAGDAAFILKVDTNRLGATNNKTFRLALNPARAYDCTIAWGDGTSTVVTGYPASDPARTYGTAGIKTITITQRSAAGFPQVRFANGGDANKVIELVQWGQVDWQSFEDAFYGCGAMKITATDAATARTGSVTDFARAWTNCLALTSFPLIDTSAGQNFQSTWENCGGLTSFPLINTSQGTNFQRTWRGCRSLTSFPALDTAKGANFTETWYECWELTSFPIVSLGSATELRGTWFDCRSLTAFPLLDTSRIVTFGQTWAKCRSLADFPSLNVARGEQFKETWTNCSAMTTFPPLNMSNGIDFSNAWSGCDNLTSFGLINTASGKIFSYAWSDCTKLASFPHINVKSAIDLSDSWSGCEQLTAFPALDTGSVTNFNSAWERCTGLTSFPLINTSSATDLSSAWWGCTGLTSFPLINTSAVTDLSSTWYGCTGLTSFPLINTSAATNLNGTWQGCAGLTTFPRINTAKVVSFAYAWADCSSLTSFPLLNTAIGKDFRRTWSFCRALKSFPVLDLGKLTDGSSCFYGSKLPTDTYSQLLNNLAASNTNPDVNFHGGASQYSISAIGARNTLLDRGWNIADGGMDSPRITSPPVANAIIGKPFQYQITATESPTAYQAWPLPSGLTINLDTGLISGTPTGPIGHQSCDLTVSNDYGQVGEATLHITVSNEGAPKLTSPNSASGSPNVLFQYQITATNNPTAFGAILPPGLSINSSTGAIFGTMPEEYFGNVVISAENSNGVTYGYFKLTIGDPPDSGGGGGTTGGAGGSGGGCGMGGGTAAFVLFGVGLFLLHAPGFRRQRRHQASNTSRGR